MDSSRRWPLTQQVKLADIEKGLGTMEQTSPEPPTPEPPPKPPPSNDPPEGKTVSLDEVMKRLGSVELP
jgi:hypothetical protein